ETIIKDAEKQITELIQSGPATAEMLNTLAVTELKLGKKDDAIQVLEQALTQSPGDLISAILMARMKLGQKDEKGAGEGRKKAIEASPKSVEPQLALGRFYVALKKDAEADQVIRHALELEPKSALVLRDLAMLENRTARKKEAEEHFKQLSGLGV